jgi:flagellar export protein FliJ
MPFRFRLQFLLRQREFKLNEARTALAAAESFRMEIQAHIDRLREKFLAAARQLEGEQAAGIVAGRYLSLKNYMSVLEQEVFQFRQELEKADAEVLFRRQVVIESDKSLKLLENIRSREKEAYNWEMARREQKRADETAVLRDYRERGLGARRDER